MRSGLYSAVFFTSLFIFCFCASVSTVAQTQKTLNVILFLDTECPISQGYMPELQRIYEKYVGMNVRFESVFPVYTVTDQEIKTFFKTYQASFPGYVDKDLKRVRRYHATVMPQAILLDKNGTIIYQGAIDNLYVSLGKNRPKATEFYLRNAIEATLNGDPVIVKKTNAVGCLINLD